jgi:putative ABC transport system permease protein
LLSGNDKPLQIVGVIQDYHQESLRKKVEPVIFKFEHPYEFGYYTFRTKTDSRGDALNYLQDVYKKHFPNDPFVFYFMDNFFAKQYESDVIFGKLLALFSIMSIVVASLGLFGLASLNVQLRTKEIGIRKVVGASVSSILLLLSKDYIKLTIIGFVIASPILYYINNQWLSLFSYRITLHWWMFVLPGLIVLLIAWGIVCIQSLKAANVNPVRTLRSE